MSCPVWVLGTELKSLKAVLLTITIEPSPSVVPPLIIVNFSFSQHFEMLGL